MDQKRKGLNNQQNNNQSYNNQQNYNQGYNNQQNYNQGYNNQQNYNQGYNNEQNYNQKNYKPVMTEPSRNELSELTYDKKFAYNFCSCCEDGKLCCLGTFCLPCFVYCLYKDAKESTCSACWQCFTFSMPYKCCWSNLSQLRTKIRGTYKLHGSIQEDIYYTTLCPCCAAIQMKLELRSQGVTND